MAGEDLERIRKDAPLVHNITNYVVMNTTANALLALGASPVMAHAAPEVEEMVGLARALVINIGTLSPSWVESMLSAGRAAKRRGIPIVLDPVGAGATSYRTKVATNLLEELTPTIVRGNASEVRALAQLEGKTRGVDSAHSSDDALDAARSLASRFKCVVSVSGAVDLIVSDGQVGRVRNGVALMTRVTGMGCTATAVTGAFAAVSSSPFHAALHAMALMGVAGEIAAARSSGPGSFQVAFLDVLHGIAPKELEGSARVEVE